MGKSADPVQRTKSGLLKGWVLIIPLAPSVCSGASRQRRRHKEISNPLSSGTA
ncbi:hypothetical protein BDZ45DRAFT_667780 [Acephala macrosclerotiorum]|nr:hypothetical protein BDZ45DRAFT_667780 [Acephala macrosclerotiorum]